MSLALYRAMMKALGMLDDPAAREKSTKPYNLLVTRDWMFAVPRRQECYESISLNALAFAGAMLVRDGEQLNVLKKRGPMAALEYVAVSIDSQATQ